MTIDDLVDAGAAELLAGRADAYVSQTVAQMYENAIAVINVVEPLIREDEKAKVLAVEAKLVPATVEAELSFYRDDLRYKVESLDQLIHVSNEVAYVRLDDVLALLAGSSDGPR